MQVIFFFLCLIFILAVVPYTISLEAAFDLNKAAGGARIKLFGIFTLLRAAAVLEGKALKIRLSRDRYLYISLVEAAVNLFAGEKSARPYLPLGAVSFEEILITVEQGSAENIELTALAGGVCNALGGALYAFIKSTSPETAVSMSFKAVDSGNFRIYGKSIISVRPTDIIKDIFRKKILKKA